jgi:hypothetical protein
VPITLVIHFVKVVWCRVQYRQGFELEFLSIFLLLLVCFYFTCCVETKAGTFMLLSYSFCVLNSCRPLAHQVSPKSSAPHSRVSRPDLSHGAVDGNKNFCVLAEMTI